MSCCARAKTTSASAWASERVRVRTGAGTRLVRERRWFVEFDEAAFLIQARGGRVTGLNGEDDTRAPV
jgi:hypothetical protein